MFSKIKGFLAGKKVYILAVTGAITSIVAWSTGDITLTALIEYLFAAFGSMSFKAAIAKTESE